MQAGTKKESDDDRHSSRREGRGGPLEVVHMGLTAILWLIGMAVVILGALLLTDSRMRGLKSLQQFGPLQNAAILVIVIGVLVIVLGLSGCIAINTRSRPLLFAFSFFLFFLVILEIAACVLAWYYRKGTSLEQRLNSLITRVIQQYGEGRASYRDGDEDWNFNSNALNFIEYTLKCCGASGLIDYTRQHMVVPPSCYNRDYFSYDRNNYNTYNDNYNSQGAAYNEIGCVQALQEFLFKHGLTIGLLCVFALLIEIVLIILSLVLASRISSDESSPKSFTVSTSKSSPSRGGRAPPSPAPYTPPAQELAYVPPARQPQQQSLQQQYSPLVPKDYRDQPFAQHETVSGDA